MIARSIGFLVLVIAFAPTSGFAQATKPRPNDAVRIDPTEGALPVLESKPTAEQAPASKGLGSPWGVTPDDFKGLKSAAMIGLLTIAPTALLMFTSFVRINIVLVLLRQALGSPQVPGNQVLSALALLLTMIVMTPTATTVYTQAIEPYASGDGKTFTAAQAWDAGSRPVKGFMLAQIERTNHVNYLMELYDIAEPPTPGRFEPTELGQFPLRVVAPAFLLSELTTAMMIGFMIYLPFLVVDLVVSAVLSAMGLFMLPPSLVALPLKLVLFVLADGWLTVASSLLRTFTI